MGVDDLENGAAEKTYETSGDGSGSSPPDYGTSAGVRQSLGRRVIDSFKRDPNQQVTPKGVVGANGRVYDAAAAATATAESPLQRHLKARHLQMIAIGGSIGMVAKRAIMAKS